MAAKLNILTHKIAINST